MADKIYADPTPKYFKLDVPNNSVKDVLGYYVKVIDTGSITGTTEIFRKTKDGTITNLGQIPKKGQFQNTGSASKEEIKYISDNLTSIITDQAVPVVRRTIGGAAGGGNAQINDVLGTNLASPPPPPTAAVQNAADVNTAVGGAKDINLPISAKSRSGYGNYYYPSDLASNRQDRIKFTMKTSEGSVISTKNIGKAFSRRGGTDIGGSVTLPIQPSISDDNTVDWSGATLNPILAYAAGASIALQSSADIGERIGDIMGTISKELKDYKKNKNISDAMKVFFAQEAVGVQGLLSRATGAVLNPNLELLFNGPSLRPFGFTFKMSPRDDKEAIQVKNIIRFFKQGMAVKRGENAIFLKSPNVFDIKYQTYDKKEGKEIPHPSIGRIKTCALMGCSVDYAPDNTYMTFDDDDRTMTSYQMTLRFSELDPIYESDYSDSTGKATDPYNIGPNEIGF